MFRIIFICNQLDALVKTQYPMIQLGQKLTSKGTSKYSSFLQENSNFFSFTILLYFDSQSLIYDLDFFMIINLSAVLILNLYL